ncbi:acid protease [Auricularia subglabra TFB-10046 SS5]|nr:acid protease [Auricularia subglabra TFB-10046 SS5]
MARLLLVSSLAVCALAESLTLKLKAHHRPGKSLLKRDKADPIPVGNNAINYFANVTISGHSYNLLVDTGSAYTWVGANKTYIPEPGAINTHETFRITYGSGYVNGTQWIDTRSTSPSASQGIDGILGLGGILQTEDTVSHTDLVPTWTNNLLAQGQIADEVLGVYFRPLARGEPYAVNGELTIGWIDEARYAGELTYAPAETRDGMLSSWVVTIDALSSNGTELDRGNYWALVDTGATNIYVPVDAYFPWLDIEGGEWDETYYLSRFPKKPTGNFGFTIGGKTFELTPDQYLVPEDQYHVWNLPSGVYWSFISTAGPENFYIGQKFIEHIYTVYDTKNLRMGFAPAVHDDAVSATA